MEILKDSNKLLIPVTILVKKYMEASTNQPIIKECHEKLNGCKYSEVIGFALELLLMGAHQNRALLLILADAAQIFNTFLDEQLTKESSNVQSSGQNTEANPHG